MFSKAPSKADRLLRGKKDDENETKKALATTHRVTCPERATGKCFKTEVTHKQQ